MLGRGMMSCPRHASTRWAGGVAGSELVLVLLLLLLLVLVVLVALLVVLAVR